MDQPAKREPLFDCSVCLEPSYQPKPEIDFGKAGQRELTVCGECLRKGDAEKVFDRIVQEFFGFFPVKLITEVIYKTLVEYRQPPQQGS